MQRAANVVQSTTTGVHWKGQCSDDWIGQYSVTWAIPHIFFVLALASGSARSVVSLLSGVVSALAPTYGQCLVTLAD